VALVEQTAMIEEGARSVFLLLAPKPSAVRRDSKQAEPVEQPEATE
jgi:hypothetical protein